MWRRSKDDLWIWLAAAGVLWLSTPRGRRSAARLARRVAEWLEEKPEQGGRGQSARPFRGGRERSEQSRGRRNREEQVVWWMTGPDGEKETGLQS
ncbi:MAG: hypothetical protein QJR06_02905 [Alicyclobacillaceae bacterium]|nr:hypothetical protein [Alicyclobacillaceae bacterium]